MAAAGTGGIIKKHPLASALIGGGLAATAIYLAARSAGGQDDADAGAEDEEEGQQAEDRADDQSADDEADDSGEGDESEEDEEDDKAGSASGQNNRNGARQRTGSRGV
jgi:hypothetical protein